MLSIYSTARYIDLAYFSIDINEHPTVVHPSVHGFKCILQVAPRPINVHGISETFLSPNDHDARLAIEGFHQPERLDRKGKRGGGLLAIDSVQLRPSS